MKELNQAHSTIKFTAEWTNNSIPFLDTCVSLESGCLTTDLFTKPTDTNTLLLTAATHNTAKKPSHSARPYRYAASAPMMITSGSGVLS